MTEAIKTEILANMAKAFFASAWADECEESDNAGLISGREIMDVMPTEIDPAATHAAQTLYMDMERVNGKTIVELLDLAIELHDGDRPATAEYFGHYCAMQAMGHGVGLDDAFGYEAYDKIKVPYVEFGLGSLEKDYFK